MRLTLDELADRLGLDPDHVRRLADAGAIARADDGGFQDGDVHRVRLLAAFEAAGVPMDALVAAYHSGDLTFDFYDELHPSPGDASPRSYAAFSGALGAAGTHLPALFAAFGLAEPDPATRLPVADEALLAELAATVEATGRPDLGVLLRFDGLHDAVDGVFDLLDALPVAGLPHGHAGIASGPIVARDGDVFGRTVNLAARLSDAAPDGQLLVPAALAPELEGPGLAITPAGRRALHGVGELDLVAVTRTLA